MNEKMSQDDIDKMLKAASGEAVSAQESPKKDKVNFTPDDIDIIGEIGNIFMGSASTTLSMLLNQKVDISTPTVDVFSSIQDTYILNEDRIIVEITYIQGLEGTVVLALKTQDAAIIADLMMGGNGLIKETTEVGELQLSAVGESMNQMVGSASTSLSSMLNTTINISFPEIKVQKKDKNIEINKDLLVNPIVAVKFILKIGTLIDSEIIQFMSVNSAQTQINLVQDLMQNMKSNLNDNSSQSIVDGLMTKHAPPKAMDSTPMKPSPPPPPPQMQQMPPPPPPQPQQHGWNPPPQPEYPQQQITVQPVQFSSFDNASSVYGSVNQNLNLVMDVKLELTVELGRTILPIKNVLELTRGSIIELDKIAGEPVELYANGKLIAKGEVVVIEDNFGLRITNILSPEQRIKEI